MYQFQAYPKWKYHETKAAVIVADPAEEKKLGKGWQDTPFPAPPVVEKDYSDFVDPEVG